MLEGGSLYSGIHSNRCWGRIKSRGGLPCLPGGNVKVLGRNKAEKKLVTCDGNLKKIIQGRDWGKWHMLPLVDVTYSVIEIRIWVGRWLEIMVEDDRITEG